MRAPAILGLALGLAPLPAAPQSGPPPPDDVAARADSLMVRDGDAGASLALLERALAHGDAYELRWRAARAATALGVLADGRPARRDSVLGVAVRHGEAAVRLRPGAPEGLYWRVAAKGRLSLHQPARAAADLASAVEAEARALLAIDSLHAGAHNALGRLALEVMVLPAWKRALGRILAGDALAAVDWETAERHLLRAAALEPGNALYLRDLAALHFERGRERAARILLERLVERRDLAPWDRVFQDEARAMLDALDHGDASTAPEGAGARARDPAS